MLAALPLHMILLLKSPYIDVTRQSIMCLNAQVPWETQACRAPQVRGYA